MTVDFSDDASALIGRVVSGHSNLNDLAVSIQNGTTSHWSIDDHIEHGLLQGRYGRSPLHAVNASSPHEKPTEIAFGLTAQGAGCNIGVVITSSLIRTKFVVIVATPSNKPAFLKLAHTRKSQNSAKDYWDIADDEDKRYGSAGWASMSADGITVKAMITGTTPATAFIELS